LCPRFTEESGASGEDAFAGSTLKDWSVNIAGHVKNGGDSKIEILKAADGLGYDEAHKRGIDHRYQHAGPEDLTRGAGIYFILSGNRWPGPGGYTW